MTQEETIKMVCDKWTRKEMDCMVSGWDMSDTTCENIYNEIFDGTKEIVDFVSQHCFIVPKDEVMKVYNREKELCEVSQYVYLMREIFGDRFNTETCPNAK